METARPIQEEVFRMLLERLEPKTPYYPNSENPFQYVMWFTYVRLKLSVKIPMMAHFINVFAIKNEDIFTF